MFMLLFIWIINNFNFLINSNSGKKLDEIHSYSTKRVAQGVINLSGNNNGESPANNTNNSSNKRFFFSNKDENNSTSLNSDSKTRLKVK